MTPEWSGELLFQARRLLKALDANVQLSKSRGGMGADLLSMDAALLTSIHTWEGLRKAIEAAERAQAPEPQGERLRLLKLADRFDGTRSLIFSRHGSHHDALHDLLDEAASILRSAAQPEAQQPAAEPKLADHAFVECSSRFPCGWCHHPDCGDTPRSGHPEGR